MIDLTKEAKDFYNENQERNQRKHNNIERPPKHMAEQNIIVTYLCF